ncbi:hypothetical protein MR475_01450, partial [bacterium]|nr:hypothetical protein [bacterium]
WPSTYEKASKYNHQLIAPSQLKPERETVLSLSRENYEKVEAWYRRRLIPIRINRAVRAIIPRSIKDIVKAALGRK